MRQAERNQQGYGAFDCAVYKKIYCFNLAIKMLSYIYIMDNKDVIKKTFRFNCEKCNYNTCKKSSWINHLQTKKHNDNGQNKNDNKCICGKKYTNRHNLSRHKKTCKIINNTENNEETLKMDKKMFQMPKNAHFCLSCGKSYKFQSSLSKHKKNCYVIQYDNEDDSQISNTQDNNIIMMEIKDMLKELLNRTK